MSDDATAPRGSPGERVGSTCLENALDATAISVDESTHDGPACVKL